MGFSKMESVIDELRKMSKDGLWYYELGKENAPDSLPTDLRFDSIIVDMQSLLASLHCGKRVVTGRDVLEMLQRQLESDARLFETRRFVFCFDDSAYVYNAKDRERAARQRSRTSGVKPYSDDAVALKPLDENEPIRQVAIADYEYGLETRLPLHYEQVLATRQLLARWKRFVARLLVEHVEHPSPHHCVALYVCGAQLELATDPCVKQILFMAGERMKRPLEVAVPDEELAAIYDTDDEERYESPGETYEKTAAEHAKKTALKADRVLPRVRIGESECRAFYWLRRLIDKYGDEIRSVLVRANDSDSVALAMFAVPRELYSHAKKAFTRHLWLDLTARRNAPRFVDAVAMWTNLMATVHDIRGGLMHATEIIMLVAMLTGNDYARSTHKLSPKVAFAHLRARYLPDLIDKRAKTPVRVIRAERGVEGAVDDLLIDEDSVIEFIVGALRDAVKPDAPGAKKRKESVANAMQDAGVELGKTELRELCNKLHTQLELNVTRGEDEARKAGKSEKDVARVRSYKYHLPDYGGLRATVRTGFASLHYFMNGHVEVERDAYACDAKGRSIFGYARDADGTPVWADAVSLSAYSGQPFVSELSRQRAAERRKRKRADSRSPVSKKRPLEDGESTPVKRARLYSALRKRSLEIKFDDCDAPSDAWLDTESIALSHEDRTLRANIDSNARRGLPVPKYYKPEFLRETNEQRARQGAKPVVFPIDFSGLHENALAWKKRRSVSSSPVQGEHGTFLK